MTGAFQLLAAIAASYALGSVPTGLWLGLWLRGVDIREHGSRNIGATNTLRVLGKGLGVLALLGDVLKGLIAVLLFARAADWIHLPLVCGLAAILGHTFSLFLRFRGGKGVATSTGVYIGLAPLPTLIAAVLFGIVAATTRMVSAASISAAVALTLCVFLFPASWPLRLITVLIAVLVIVKHRENIKRILRGEENRF
jgi:acyl phosphate:glycerol-3-phosphate acyltransferase